MANKSEITTRIEEENKTALSEGDDTSNTRKTIEFNHLPDDSDDESDELVHFNLKHAWHSILKIPECHQIMIGVPTQRALGIEVGINVSQEFPWKQVTFKSLVDKLFDEVERGKELREIFPDYPPDDLVLMGYMPTLTEDQVEADPRDPFLIFSDHDAAKHASQIIKNIEIYEKWVINKALVKKSHFWKNFGSEKEVELGIPIEKEVVNDIEVQSVYPVQPFKPQYKLRSTSDVRDGYAELIPINIKSFENVHRKRLHVAVQSAAAKVNLEQQTDPTFPTNAWSQYLYEIQAEDDGLDETSEDEAKSKPLLKTPSPSPVSIQQLKQPPIVSKEVEDLLKILEFNQVDMYRNDYPLISDIKVSKFSSPYLEDIFCYADISKSHGRYVIGIDWYPAQSGVLALSYCYKTYSTYQNIELVDDMEGNVIMNPTIALIWSFSDSLNFKLELATTRGVTALAFCPNSPNLLIGGRYNGSVILWDLQQRIANLDYEEIITIDQAKYRVQMKEFLDWTFTIDEQFFVNSAFISAHDTSPQFCITNIIWLQQNHYITTSGKIHEVKDGKIQRFFLTSSIDGVITFWNLDINMDKKILANQRGKQPVPPLLTTQQSDFDKYDRIFKPVFMLLYPEPISFTIYEGAKFKYEPYGYMKNEKDFAKKYPIKVTAIDVPKKIKKTERKVHREDDEEESEIDTLADKESHQILISSTFFGNIVKYSWDGYEIDMGNPVNKEKITNFKLFASCHDGPILGLEQNPHYPEVFASIGRYVLAIWKKDYLVTPILWRKRPSELTGVKWSTDRPAVLYVTRADGYFEAWDILARDDEPSLSDVLGGGIITAISEHRPLIPKKVLGIADYNSSFRMVALPSSFQNPYPNEKECLEKFIEKEEKRKKAIRNWEIHWMNKNQDIREARKLTLEEALKDLDKFKEETEKKPKRKSKEVDDEEETRKSKELPPQTTKKTSFDLPEKLEKIWDEMNLNRLMDALMSRKMVDADKLEKQTFLEKQRLAYEKNKRMAIKASILKIHDEVAEIKSRLLPIHKARTEVDVIGGLVINIIYEAVSFGEIEKDCDAFIAETPIEGDINFKEFFIRGAQRRKLINKSLGGNTQRLDLFKKMKINKRLDDFDYGYELFTANSEIFEGSDYSQPLENTPSYSDLDEIPVKIN